MFFFGWLKVTVRIPWAISIATTNNVISRTIDCNTYGLK